ncbi:MAG: autotransporter outer membrane beta-barrel domain-containing protein [Marinibacterium sp.]|nr:autotransporter outer membrane beta-barrel domain-containing protein [Marinibacterium sp.]
MKPKLVFPVITVIAAAPAQIAQAACTQTGSETYTCSGDFSGQTIRAPGNVPDSVTSVTIENLTSDIGPQPNDSYTNLGVVGLNYGVDALAGSVNLLIDDDTFGIASNGIGDGGGLLITSVGGDGSGTLAGIDDRNISLHSNVDIGFSFGSASSNYQSALTIASHGGDGGTPGKASNGNGSDAGAGGAGGDVSAILGGTYSTLSGTGSIGIGVGILTSGGDGGTGGASSRDDGGTGGTGGAGGTITLGTNADLSITAGGPLSSTINRAGIYAWSLGGKGGDGGNGNDKNGSAGAGGAGGNIAFVDTTGTTRTIATAGVPGIYLLSQGERAGSNGHSVAGDSGRGGNITKNTGSTTIINSTGDGAAGLVAISRGGNGVETNGNYNTPGQGGNITLKDTWNITTDGTSANGIAAYSIAGQIASGASSAISSSGGTVTIDTAGGKIETKGDESFGILAQSIAGHDGSGGTSDTPGINFGVSANTPFGNGASVNVTNAADILTIGTESAGIGAQATGGGGGSLGTSFDEFFSGSAQTAGGAGGTVAVKNTATINTKNAGSDGIIAQSIGGAGGVGSSSTPGSTLGSAPTRDGSDGGQVTVTNSGTITAGNTETTASSDPCGGGCSTGILAQSIGGGGGKGHTAKGAFHATGGKGGDGGDGGSVGVLNFGLVQTYLDHSAAIEAQSIGGGGGKGGGAVAAGTVFSHAVGGQGGDGGNGGDVLVQNTYADVVGEGENSDAIHAQSVGGGGGRGGFAVAGTIEGVSLAVGGGKGGSGGDGGAVNVCLDQTNGGLNAACQPVDPPRPNPSSMVTIGDNAKGVFAHSVGGGGGNGGFSVAVSASVGLSEAFAIGGKGGGGGSGGTVNIDGSFEMVETTGDDAGGIVGMSVGGGGGSGGLAVAGSVTIAADDAGAGFSVAVGGDGSKGGAGAAVGVNATGTVSTQGDRSSGILAQSVGGGGGNGGASVAGTITSPSSTSVSLALGGAGGSGNNAEAVNVTYAQGTGSGITTGGQSAHGIAAQSIAGGGGHGGMSVAGAISFSESTTITMSIGGEGGNGGTSGAVNVNNSGKIATSGYDAHGILAQSSGGSGGYGGMSLAGAITTSKSQSLNMAVAGQGGDGAVASTVAVANHSAITVSGAQSKAIIAQSVGGAGGYGGMAVTGQMTESDDSKSVSVSVGGKGGKGGEAAAVTVTNSAALVTGSGASDTDALYQGYGILAQSISGDGGYGGMAVTAETNQGQKTVELAVGGSGGGTGAAGTVQVNSHAAITTKDDNSDAILAQSVGGNGGAGGMTVNAAYTDSDASTNTYSVSVGGGGGSSAQSKEAKVIHSSGAIQTQGENAAGIVAQSIGGGGGNGGSNISYNTDVFSGGKTSASKASVNVGGSGDNGSPAGTVFVELSGGSIETGTNGMAQDEADAHTRGHGIFAQSLGGGGGNGGMGMIGDLDTSKDDNGGSVTVGGSGGSGASANNVTVSVTNATASITTHLRSSDGVQAQSIGGGGGNGAIGVKGDVTTSGSKGVFATIGGSGGKASSGATVSVSVASAITTHGVQSRGITAQSIGGGGGNGGVGVSGNMAAEKKDDSSGKLFGFAMGGQGGAASDGGAVTVTLGASGSIQTLAAGTTAANASHGILAQSIGGGGGNGGYAVGGSLGTNEDGGKAALMTLGATGGTGGAGKTVTLDSAGAVSVAGDFANGILAQSIGGGGGAGGLALGGELVTASGHEIVLGGNGSGGDAKPGGAVNATITGAMSTGGDYGHAIVLQSIGGGGGASASSMKGGINQAKAGSMSMILGGESDKGGDGGAINFNQSSSASSAKAITTAGSTSFGLLAQSVGGGGGLALAEYGASASTLSSIETAAGVQSGSQDESDGGTVTLTNHASITTGTKAAGDSTSVLQSHGIIAQSIGAGGGVALTTGTLTFDGSVSVSERAGAADVEGNSALVKLENRNSVTTHGVDSHAILAQSIAGGGGLVGNLTKIEFTSGDVYKAETNIGGTGGSNKSAVSGGVDLINTSTLTTSGDGSYGVLAQVISGGGGYSSSLFGIDAALHDPGATTVEAGNTSDFSIRLGGESVLTKGEQDGNSISGSVTVGNSANITTSGRSAIGILAQNIGGGGGVAFDGGWNNSSDKPFKGLTVDLAIGGKDVDGEDNDSKGASGSLVVVQHNAGTIQTSGRGASGIYAQSIGGGGGRGFVGGVTTDGSAPVVGGTDGTDGDGGSVSVSVNPGAVVRTGFSDDDGLSVAAFGVFAQSVGGGGGHGGATSFNISNGANAGTKLGDGNTAGAGGDVNVGVSGVVETQGDSSVGVFAQSVGGGGGLLGTANTGTGVSFGSNGGTGKAGPVTVDVSGTVSTTGTAAHAIIAQSASGSSNKGQPITVVVGGTGRVSASGSGAYGLWLDSAGDNTGTISVTNYGTISGGRLTENPGSSSATSPDSATGDATVPVSAAAVGPVTGPVTAATSVSDDNADAGALLITNAEHATITNTGTISTIAEVDGDLLRSAADMLTITNSGTLVGDIHHSGAGASITNHAEGTLRAGASYDIGGTGAGVVTNHGRLEILGTSRTGTTAIDGDLEQSASGVLAMDLSPSSGGADRLTVTGTATLDGAIEYRLLDLGRSTDGPQSIDLIAADGGITLPSGALIGTQSAVAGFATTFEDGAVRLTYDIDFEGQSFANPLTQDRQAVARYLTALQDAGELTDLLLTLTELETETDYGDALSSLNGSAYADSHAAILLSNMDFESTAGRCDTLGRTVTVNGLPTCSWVTLSGQRYDIDDGDKTQGFSNSTFTLAGGVDLPLEDGRSHIGAAFQYVRHSIDSDAGSSSSGHSFQALFHAGRTVDDLSFGLFAGGGSGSFDVTRTALGDRLDSDMDVPFVNLGAYVSRRFDRGAFYVEPKLRVGSTHFFSTSASENGGLNQSLSIETADQTSIYIRPALRIGTERILSGGLRMMAFGEIGVTGFLQDDDLRISAAFRGASDGIGSFETLSPVSSPILDLDAGVTLAARDNWQVQATAFGRVSDEVRSVGASLQFGLQF